MTRASLGIGALVLGLVSSVPLMADDDPLLYRVVEGRVIFTNQPSHGDVQPVPGFEPASEHAPERVAGRRSEPAPALPSTPFDSTIERVALEAGLSPTLIKAVALVESNLDPGAVSAKGARGLMQLMPATAERYGVRDSFDPEQNLRGGALHLRAMIDDFGGDLTLALAAYNAGPGAVRRHGGVPAYKETRDYVRKVHARLGQADFSQAKTQPVAGRPARRTPTGVTLRRADDGSILLSN